jgi:2-dehydro-3-deoxygluconokinase
MPHDQSHKQTSMAIKLRDPAKCKVDVVALGECMVRLAPPGNGRIEFAKSLEVDVGGGEFNVAYACARLGMRGGFISKLPENPVARIILNHARAAGMSVDHVVMEKYDGLGRANRVGLNFTEVGAGVRPSVTVYDRGHSSASHMRPEDFDWKAIFGGGVRWFHTGGIMTALSDSCAATVKAALKVAKEAGAVTSYDFNFRSALWNDKTGKMIRDEIAPLIDVLMGNEHDMQKILGGRDEKLDDPSRDGFKRGVEQFSKKFPNVKAICTTLRTVKSSTINDFGGVLWSDGAFYESRTFSDLEIVDRVGGGDGFSSGIVYGFSAGMKPQEIVDFATAQGALLHTTRGDTSQATLDEVMHVMRGGSARIQR